MQSSRALVTSFFFMWGLLTVLTALLIPFFQQLFELTYLEVMFTQFSFYIAYGLFSLPFGIVLNSLGYQSSFTVAVLLSGVGAILFFPAVAIGSFSFFLFALFVLSSGLVLLQVSSNPYITITGPEKSASSRLNFAQGFNSLGTVLAPVIGVIFFLTYNYIKWVYLIIGLIFLSLACIIRKTPFKKNKTFMKKWSVSPYLLKSAFGIFFYVGAEVGVGSFLSLLFIQEYGLDVGYAGMAISIYWAGAMIGRFAGARIMKTVDPRILLKYHALINLSLLLLGLFFSQLIFLYLFMGLFNSIMYPTIFSLGVKETNRSFASAFLCTFTIGGALLPLLQGYVADIFSLGISLIVPFFCYLYIFYFSKLDA